jgi:hypothetical protein
MCRKLGSFDLSLPLHLFLSRLSIASLFEMTRREFRTNGNARQVSESDELVVDVVNGTYVPL